MSTLSVVIPTWNNADLTIRCLHALRRNTVSDLHIVWIDNGSSREQHAAMRDVVQTFPHDRERYWRPLGFARATNRGLAYIRGEYTVFLNNDVEVCPDWDVQLREAVDQAPGAAGPFVLGSADGAQSVGSHRWLGIPSDVTEPESVARFLRARWGHQVLDVPPSPPRAIGPFRGMLAFFCVLLPTVVVRAVGALDEQFGWGYYEDDDYCMRLRRAGYAISLCPASVVHHDVAVLSGMSETTGSLGSPAT